MTRSCHDRLASMAIFTQSGQRRGVFSGIRCPKKPIDVSNILADFDECFRPLVAALADFPSLGDEQSNDTGYADACAKRWTAIRDSRQVHFGKVDEACLETGLYHYRPRIISVATQRVFERSRDENINASRPLNRDGNTSTFVETAL